MFASGSANVTVSGQVTGIDPGQDSSDNLSVDYINRVVLKGVIASGISINSDYQITNDCELSASEFVEVFKKDGWWWPSEWYKQNRNIFAHDSDAIHLEKEVEQNRWIHLVVSPGLKEVSYSVMTRAGPIPMSSSASDWTLHPRKVELHAETDWLQPSSKAHLEQWVLKQGLRF
jgi:hypothetical protein